MKLSYVISKKSDKSGKSNFRFNNDGGFKWFEIFHKKEESVQAENPNELTNLISRFETDFEGTAKVDSETRFELEGSVAELKELGTFAVSYSQEEGNFLKTTAAWIKEYFKGVIEMFTGINRSINEVDRTEEALDKANEEIRDLKDQIKKLQEKEEKSE